MIDKTLTISLNVDSSIKDYILLMKPRVMTLVVFTSITGLLNATKTIHPFIGFVAILCVIMGAGSAAAFNMWYDRDIDGLMERTKGRPIIIGNVAPDEALSFSIVLGFLSVFLMALAVNFLASILLATSILYYDIIYTMWLKRSSIQNIVIGGVSGALPPLIGTVSVDNAITLEGLLLSSIIFLWTPPHSFALVLYKIEDYTKASIPMMPVIKGKTYTKALILIYTVLMIIISLLPVVLKLGSYYYLATSCLLGGIFFYYTLSLFTTKELLISKKLFVYSIYYLFIIFLILCINPIIYKYLGFKL